MFQFVENTILQKIGNQEKIWTIPELLETHNPLPGVPLAERNAAFVQVMYQAEAFYSDLSEAARLRYDFWQQLRPGRVAEQRFEYPIKVADTYQWELTINSEGLFYKDISGQYTSNSGNVTEQLFSDFWFFGPLLPLPDLQTRKVLVAAIRNAFAQVGSPAAYKHFELFEYPTATQKLPNWTTDDAFINVQPFGIEHGGHDGRGFPEFISFEHFMSVAATGGSIITFEIRAAIEAYLAPIAKEKRWEKGPFDLAESKRLFMDNGGDTHYIYLDGDGDRYYGKPSDEALWRKELLDIYEKRLREEDNVTILAIIARSMRYNGVTNVDERFIEAAKTAPANVKQALEQVLAKP